MGEALMNFIAKYENLILVLMPTLTFIITLIYVFLTYKLVHNPYNAIVTMDIDVSANEVTLQNHGQFPIKLIKFVYYYHKNTPVSKRDKSLSALHKIVIRNPLIVHNDKTTIVNYTFDMINYPIALKYQLLSGKLLNKYYQYCIYTFKFLEINRLRYFKHIIKYYRYLIYVSIIKIIYQENFIIDLSILHVLLKLKLEPAHESEITNYLVVSNEITEDRMNRMRKKGWISEFTITGTGKKMYDKNIDKLKYVNNIIRKGSLNYFNNKEA